MSQMPAKLLVTPIGQRVIPGTRLETTEVLSHPMKHPFSRRPSLPNSSGFPATELSAMELSEKSEIVETILLLNSLH